MDTEVNARTWLMRSVHLTWLWLNGVSLTVGFFKERRNRWFALCFRYVSVVVSIHHTFQFQCFSLGFPLYHFEYGILALVVWIYILTPFDMFLECRLWLRVHDKHIFIGLRFVLLVALQVAFLVVASWRCSLDVAFRLWCCILDLQLEHASPWFQQFCVLQYSTYVKPKMATPLNVLISWSPMDSLGFFFLKHL